jgi:hypothetical protein
MTRRVVPNPRSLRALTDLWFWEGMEQGWNACRTVIPSPAIFMVADSPTRHRPMPRYRTDPPQCLLRRNHSTAVLRVNYSLGHQPGRHFRAATGGRRRHFSAWNRVAIRPVCNSCVTPSVQISSFRHLSAPHDVLIHWQNLQVLKGSEVCSLTAKPPPPVQIRAAPPIHNFARWGPFRFPISLRARGHSATGRAAE